VGAWRVQQKHIDEVLEASSRFSKDTEEKILQKMSSSLRQREQQFERLMERLQKHVRTNIHTVIHTCIHTCYYYYDIHLTAFFPGQPG